MAVKLINRIFNSLAELFVRDGSLRVDGRVIVEGNQVSEGALLSLGSQSESDSSTVFKVNKDGKVYNRNYISSINNEGVEFCRSTSFATEDRCLIISKTPSNKYFIDIYIEGSPNIIFPASTESSGFSSGDEIYLYSIRNFDVHGRTDQGTDIQNHWVPVSSLSPIKIKFNSTVGNTTVTDIYGATRDFKISGFTYEPVTQIPV